LIVVSFFSQAKTFAVSRGNEEILCLGKHFASFCFTHHHARIIIETAVVRVVVDYYSHPSRSSSKNTGIVIVIIIINQSLRENANSNSATLLGKGRLFGGRRKTN